MNLLMWMGDDVNGCPGEFVWVYTRRLYTHAYIQPNYMHAYNSTVIYIYTAQ